MIGVLSGSLQDVLRRYSFEYSEVAPHPLGSVIELKVRDIHARGNDGKIVWRFMKTLIVGAGALGGIIGARLLAVGASVSLATRIPPGWNGRSISREPHDPWLVEILNAYGDLKASMLQDFETGT
jgi:hypothetical protein